MYECSILGSTTRISEAEISCSLLILNCLVGTQLLVTRGGGEKAIYDGRGTGV